MTGRRWVGGGRIVAIVFAILALATTAIAEGDPLARLFGGPFNLVSGSNSQVRDADFRGRFMLVYFGYTHCPDICPTGLSDLTTALDELGDAGNAIQPVFITVDPARDTPDRLAAYGRSFHPRLVLLTGTEEQIAAVAKAYKVHRRKYLFVAQDEPTNDYGVDHGSLMYLMGPDGVFRTLIPHGTPPDTIAATLKRYLNGP